MEPESISPQLGRIECPCGFRVVTDDLATLKAILESHRCPPPPPDKNPWWQMLFSMEGLLVVFLIFLLLSDLLGHK